MTAELQSASQRDVGVDLAQRDGAGGSTRTAAKSEKPKQSKGPTAAQLRAQQNAALDARIRQVLEESASDEQFPLTGEVLAHQVGSEWAVVQKRLSTKPLKEEIAAVSLKEPRFPLALAIDAHRFFLHPRTLDDFAALIENKRQTSSKPLAAIASKFVTDAALPAKLKPILAGVIDQQIQSDQLHESLRPLIEVKRPKTTPAQLSVILWDAFQSLIASSDAVLVTEAVWLRQAGLSLTSKECVAALKHPPLAGNVVPCKASVDGKQMLYVAAAVIASVDAKLLEHAFALAIKLSQSGARSKPSLGFTAQKLADAILTDKAAQQSFVDGIWSRLEKGKLAAAYASLFYEGQRILFRRSDLVPQVPEFAAAEMVANEKPQTVVSASEHAGDTFANDFDGAFRELDAKSGRRNFVKVYELRQALAQYSRAAFDAGLKQLRLANRYTMDSVFGANASLTEAERAAGIQEGQSLLVYVSRR
jgi:hypothetical protein